MKSNNLLTWTLYLLLAGLVLVFGYRACDLKKQQAAKQAEQAEMEQALRDLNYQTETGESSGVAKPGDLADAKTEPVTSTNPTTSAPAGKSTGAETVAAKTEKTATSADAKPVTHSTDAKFVDRNDETAAAKSTPKTVKPVTSSTTKRTVARSVAPAPSKKPTFAVIAGSFSDKKNARSLMESLVKKGFENAEISTKGKNFVVITHRTNDRAVADKMADLVRKEPSCASAYVYKRP